MDILQFFFGNIFHFLGMIVVLSILTKTTLIKINRKQ